MHAHYAIALYIALDNEGIRTATPVGPELHAVSRSLVRSNSPHQLRTIGPKFAVFDIATDRPNLYGMSYEDSPRHAA